MDHDPLCPTQTMCKCKDQECWDCADPDVVLCQCDLIRKVRDSERLTQLLNTDEPPWADEVRREAAAELTRLAQEMGMIP